jgi:hypothetical protein
MTKKSKTAKPSKMNMTEQRFADSQLYVDVLKACEESLDLFSQFNKRAIMRFLNNEAFTDTIRWDWIVRKIEEGHQMPSGKVQLIAVAESFFKAKAKDKAAMGTDASFPGNYIATGYGKRTAGWVLATYADGRFALYKVKQVANNITGRNNRNRALGEFVSQRLASEGNTARAIEIAKATGIPVPTPTPLIAKGSSS